MINENTKIYINPTGRFVIGGPVGDSGLTGRKIIVDTYGGMCAHGGGAFSGKDPTKVDRSAAYMGRFIAKNTGIKTVTHFRNADIVSGGQGTPISSTYFNAVATNEIHPIAYINISGKSSLTWIGSFGEIVGFDCGPGDNFINNWTAKHAHMDNDYNGRLAALGNVHEKIVNSLMHHKFLILRLRDNQKWYLHLVPEAL
mgnify:CR=1 FL=1